MSKRKVLKAVLLVLSALLAAADTVAKDASEVFDEDML